MRITEDILMISDLKAQTLSLLKIATALLPCLLSMYLLFYFEKYQVWVPQTPHRDKITILLLVAGLTLSFLAYSYLMKTKK